MAPLNVRQPLTCEPMSAVLCRVAYRLVEAEWRRQGKPAQAGPLLISVLAARLHQEGFRALASWLYVAAHHINQTGFRVAQWRDCVIRRARQAQSNREAGRPWQRVPPCY
jgi:hypothetical protein